MIAVVQRVKNASVTIEKNEVRRIGRGLVILLGVGNKDDSEDIEYIARKVVGLRIFPDDSGKMNLSVEDIRGDLLVVSQFTLYGDSRKGKRPDFTQAAQPKMAEEFYNRFVDALKKTNLTIETGVFSSDMLVEIHNDGPVTLILNSNQ
ncbi:MAG: D-aminoacyl-tRNA deacylase [bacterium]